MEQAQAQAKQQIVERIKQATNILVTVSSNPSVDQLAACIGMTLLLNKMNKHATAIFSGKVPSTLEFLQPEKTIETNTDSLQDFIISLDKNKADKLRYKVEDQVVRIFITPYRTSIGEKDLVFSHGDFNVEVVLALGIKDRTQIDQAIAAHGRILHDATVVSLNAGQGNAPALGQLNWQDANASSLSEMLVSISEAFGTGLLDGQMATSFLTGIVAETNRFSNNKTSPKVMTMAAQLMAAGANQQLIVSKLETALPPKPAAPQKTGAPAAKSSMPPLAEMAKDTLSVSHDKDKKDSPEIQVEPSEIRIDRQGNLVAPAEVKPAVTAPETPAVTPQPEPMPEPIQPVTPAAPQITPELTPEPISGHHLMAGSGRPVINPPFSADTQAGWEDPYNNTSIDPLSAPNGRPGGDAFSSGGSSASGSGAPPQGGDLGAARDAVNSALAGSAGPVAENPIAALNAQPLGYELHSTAQSTSDGQPTPSLSLPANGNGEIGTVKPYEPPADTPVAPAPPPVPPPLPLTSNPGAMLPTNPTYTPPTGP